MVPLAVAEGVDGTHRFDEVFRVWARQHPPRFEATADRSEEGSGEEPVLSGVHSSAEETGRGPLALTFPEFLAAAAARLQASVAGQIRAHRLIEKPF